MTLHLLSRPPLSQDDPILDVPRLMAQWGPQTLVVLGKADPAVLQTYLPRAQWQVFPLDKTYRKWQALLWRIVSPLPHIARLHLSEDVSEWLRAWLKQHQPETVFLHGDGSLVYIDVLRYQAPQALLIMDADWESYFRPHWFSNPMRFLRTAILQLDGQTSVFHIHADEIPTVFLRPLEWPAKLPHPLPEPVPNSVLNLEGFTDDPIAIAQAEVIVINSGHNISLVCQIGRPMLASAPHHQASPDLMVVFPDQPVNDQALAAAIADLQANPSKRSLLAAAARDYYWSHLSPQAVGQRLRTFLAELRAAKTTHPPDRAVTS